MIMLFIGAIKIDSLICTINNNIKGQENFSNL